MNDLKERFHLVMGSLTGNESLAPSLDDEAAKTLLNWCEELARAVVQETDKLDDTAAEDYMSPKLKALRLMLRSLGRLAGETAELDSNARQVLWDRAGQFAATLFDRTPTLPELNTFVERLIKNQSKKEKINILRRIIEETSSKG